MQYRLIGLFVLVSLMGSILPGGVGYAQWSVCTGPGLTIPQSECQALELFYSSTNGQNRSNRLGRSTTGDVETRYGVTLGTRNGALHVVDITLGNNNLVGTIPEGIAGLPYLETLIIPDNSITSLPSTLGGLTALEQLDLQDNLLTVLPDSIGSLSSLRILNVAENSLSVLPGTIGGLTAVDMFRADQNLLQTLPPSIGNMQELDVLNVSYNMLTSLPDQIGTFASLDSLSLNNNQLAILPDTLEGLDTLISLDVSFNQLGSLPASVGSLSTLITLTADSNPLTSLPSSISGLQALQTLSVANTLLVSFPETISSLSSLVTLKANNAQLQSLTPQIGQLSMVEYLYLQYNQMTGTLPTTFSNLTKLKRLYVYNNYLNRTAAHLADVPSSLTSWIATVPIVLRNNQGDITKPLFAQTGTFTPFVLTGLLTVPLTVAENSYAVNGGGQGMNVVFSGSQQCLALSTSPVTVNTGTIQMQITLPERGVYTGCALTLTDHGGNTSVPLSIPAFVYGEDYSDFCEHPSISVPKTECEALVALYASTNGASRTNRQNRLQSLDMEAWFGVRTGMYDGQKHVDGIFLQKSSGTDTHGSSTQRNGNNLQGVLPENIGDLPFVKDLNLSKNSGLAGTLPTTIGNIVSLEKLYINNAGLGGTLPDVFQNLTQLQYFYLAGNTLNGSLPPSLGAVHSLIALDLGNNDFVDTFPVNRSGMTALQYLNLQNNTLSGTLPGFLSGLTGVQYLYLGGNDFQGTLPQERSTMTSLKEVYLQGNALDRDQNHYAKIPGSLLARYQGRLQRDISNQRDIVSPVLSGIPVIPWLVSGSTIIEMTIQENGYAVTPDGYGMGTIFSGAGLCSTLSGSDILISSGLTSITIEPVNQGLYEDCYIGTRDHGSNTSNWIALPRFGFSESMGSICYHPDLTVPVSECEALVAFYDQTGGEGRASADYRGETHDVEVRYGITTAVRNGANHVIGIELPGNNLTNSISLSSLAVPYLENLSLYQNTLTGVVGSWSGFSALRHLDVHSNTLSSQLYDSLGYVTTLEYLNLSDNAFAGPIPDVRSNLINLTSLNLSFNILADELPTWVGSASSLLSVKLEGNAFTGALPVERQQLLSLNTLLLADNALDRTVQHIAKIPPSLANRIAGIATTSFGNQEDTTPPTIALTGSIPSTTMGAVSLTAVVYENAYAINSLGSGMSVSFAGGGQCSYLLSTSKITTGDGTQQIVVIPSQQGTYSGCSVVVSDHAGNQGSVSLGTFTYVLSCGDGVIGSGEVCDEGRFCDDGRECTHDLTLCPTECQTRFIDNCNPLCRASECGDGYVDGNGPDNISSTSDDESCDVGKFCNNGTICTANPSVCPGGPSECTTRLTLGCNPYCSAATCGDGYVDRDGPDEILDTEDDEMCDDGNLQIGDGCSTSCTLEACGDGYVDTDGANNIASDADDEECDNAHLNGILGGTCSSTCQSPTSDCMFCYEACDGGTGSNSIYLLIDVSGSMGSNQKLQKAKEGAQEFVRLIKQSAMGNTGFTSKIGLITFSSDTVTNYYPSLNYDVLTGRIASLVAGGGTNFGDPLLDATNYFKYNDTSYQQYIILLSDGLPTNTTSYQYEPIDRAYYGANAAKQEGVAIYTISVEQTFEGNDLMRRISSSALQNMALGKDTTQSSTASSRHASYAVDNDVENESRTQTQKQSNSWRQVNLGALYDIKSIKIRNRTGGQASKTSQYYIHVKTGAFSSNTLSTILADPSVESFYESGVALRPSIYNIDVPGRYVRVQLTKNEVLSMAEVEVLGCPYGVPCDNVYTFEDYESTAIELIYSHIFGAIHCNCRPERLCGVCGDGYMQATLGEQCDEGSQCNDGRNCTGDPGMCPDECRPRFSQTCSSLCTYTRCGDGVVQTPNHDGVTESCDDGNTNSGDGCTASCVAEYCGDGVVDLDGVDNVRFTEDDEQCDDGDTNNTNACANDCTSNAPGAADGTCHEFGILYSLNGDGSSAPNLMQLCDVGTPSGFAYSSGSHQRSRYCLGVEGGSNTLCTQKESYCGDGITQQYSFTESCDDGNRTNNDGCTQSCQIEAPLERMPGVTSCYDGETTAFQTKEPIPIVWQLEAVEGIDYDAATCAARDSGTFVPGASMQCTFHLLHGNDTSFVSHGQIVTAPCIRNLSTSAYSGLLYDFLEDYGITSQDVLGYKVRSGVSQVGNVALGKYHARLERVTMTVCGTNELGEPFETSYTYGNAGEQPICRMSFALTDPYLTQKGSSFGTVKGSNFETYLTADGSGLLYDAATQEVQQVEVASYSADIVEYLTNTFSEKYRRGAMVPTWAFGANRILKKVPGKELYFFKGTSQMRDITVGTQVFNDPDLPYTIIVEDADLVVSGSLEGNGLYIVKDGTIRFSHDDCDESQYVEGMFVTNSGFAISSTINSLQKNERCKRGNFQMKGILVGPGIDENFAKKRRSMLDVINMPLLENHDQIVGLDLTEISRQQKEQIYNSSAINIQTDPSAWGELPEGADYLFEAMSLFKG